MLSFGFILLYFFHCGLTERVADVGQWMLQLDTICTDLADQGDGILGLYMWIVLFIQNIIFIEPK